MEWGGGDKVTGSFVDEYIGGGLVWVMPPLM
jgi:hypothetical protein